MIEGVVIEPMTREFILWRCLHGGPITREAVDQPEPHPSIPWTQLRARNVPLLSELTDVYGACALIAWHSERIVGQLRFYPKAVCQMAAPGPGLCMQQTFPGGPADDLVDKTFPPLDLIDDKTLFVHCMMTGSPQQQENPYQRKCLGTRMVRTLIQWAKAKGWEHIEAHAFEDIPIVYEITGGAGHTFWEKIGFHVAERHPHPYLQSRDEFVVTLEEEAAALGIPPEKAKEQFIMRLDLTQT